MTRPIPHPASRFSWDNETAIVRALEAAYPRVSRFNLTPEKLEEMIRSLPGFMNGSGPPDDDIFNRLIIQWIDLDEDDDDGRWDAGA
ncbi:MAG TPA: hypothetical protein DFI00_08350 [Rhodospirillaceae bacterium]|nr:hypothetical protein [Alphaproteobacteria bacterium]OUT42125.1 MAG: hypothetical protein CBB62_07445 [Micavibrio sp. TMED2]HCI47291.1 hypothetical protein [Rhodospirillaceae bacterium]MAS46263.1 hypothetical protein [Alphaproteobacteria bacterium]MAX95551.1 hypothetical protein [Alphaproteobacteria bacterium]|tara:strand:+ start:17273 stop:17533 length:261 start_codon:yes stop_codon:yes gene_type:complete